MSKLLLLFSSFVILIAPSCFFPKSDDSCYEINEGKVTLRYYGGYPSAKEVFLDVSGADATTFKYIEGSREGACQRGHMFAKDKSNVFYRNQKIEFANPETFEPLKYGFSKDKSNVFYKHEVIEKADAPSFFVIENTKKQPYGADKYALIYKSAYATPNVDTRSFQILPRPYFRDKNRVYYGKSFKVLEEANPKSFICPKFEQVVNYQYYAYDNKNAYYYEKGKVTVISAIDTKTFKVLSTCYAKDKNKVYYKFEELEDADPASFYLPHKINKHVGQDKNNRYVNGEIDDM